jgi:hypothetical protein
LGFALVPFIVAAVQLLTISSRFHAAGDNALNELRTRDVGRHAVTLGPFARDGWHHLGPAMYYVLALPYRIFGSSSSAFFIGALLINAASVAGAALIARRHGGTPLMLLTLIGCTVAARALGADFMRDPWNPYLAVFPFLLVVFLTWAMTRGDLWALPVATAVASFCAQTHIGYVTLAIPLAAFGAAGLAWQLSRHGDVDARPVPRDVMRALVATFAVVAVMWLPPLIEQVTHSPGNFTKVTDYFGDPPSDQPQSHPLTDGIRIVGGQFVAAPGWITGNTDLAISGEPMSRYRTPIPLLLLAFVGGIVVFVWLKSRSGLWLAATLSVACALGIFSVARTVGYLYNYRLRWSWLLAMLAVVVAAWAGWMLFARAASAHERLLEAGGLCVLAALTVVNSVDAARAGMPQEPDSALLNRLTPAVVAGLPPGDGAVIVNRTNLASAGVFTGLMLSLDRQGVRVRITDRDPGWIGSHRVHRSGPVRAVLTTTANETVDDFLSRADQRLLAYAGNVPVEERARLSARGEELEADYSAQRIDEATYLEAAQDVLGQLSDARAVFIETSR